MGDRPLEALSELAGEGADFVGANCSMGSAEMLELMGPVIEGVSVPVVAKPNAGLPEHRGGQVIYRQEPADFARDLLAMVRMGARLVGGCCGTDERFIAAVRQGLEKEGINP
jgi:5-methyltetrahydrofolate--homocysteine methyltransferase